MSEKSMSTEGGNGLFRRNRDSFRESFPDIWKMLESCGEPASTLIREGGAADGKPVNIDLGSAKIYPDDAPQCTAEQVTHYFGKKLDQLVFPDPAESDLTENARVLNESLDTYLRDYVPAGLSEEPVTDIGYAFIFGIGLGYHISEMISRRVARNLVLIEPIPEFLLHSFFAVDWTVLFKEAAEQDMEIHFRVGKEPDRTVLEIEGLLIHGRGSLHLDGARAFVHYYSWSLQETRALLNQKIMNFLIRPGDFDDEVLMMENTFANLKRWDFHLVEEKTSVQQNLPAFIVGSGPSLDRDIESLKRLRDKAVVISCGSALGILLKNGIRPDLHIENENTAPLVENLKAFQDEYGFDGITLVSVLTVDPEVGGMFDKRWFYYRGPLSPSAILNVGSIPLLYAGPLVSNAAAAVLATLGFREMYLFGVDCGSREEGSHHAADAVYYEEGYDNFIEGEGHEFFETELVRTVPGNFGGKIFTSAYYDLSRRTFTELQRTYGFDFYNCGDGAKIEGTQPKASAAISLAGPEGGQKACLDMIENGLQAYEIREMPGKIDLGPHIHACDRLAERVRVFVDGAKEHAWVAGELGREFQNIKRETDADFASAFKLAGGSLEWFVRLGIYKAIRIEDGNARADFMRFFLDRFMEASERTIDNARALLEGMDKGR